MEELLQVLKLIDESINTIDYAFKYEWSWKTESRRYSLYVQIVPTEGQELMGETDIYIFCEEDTVDELLVSINNDMGWLLQ